MKQLHSLLAILVMANLFLFSCKEEDDAPPSPPLLSSEVSTLPIQFGETKSFTVTISAAGKLKTVTATTTIGTVAVDNITGVGENTGTARISFTAPYDAGTGTIKIIAADQGDQEVSSDVSVTITSLPPVELTAGDVEGTWGPSRTYIVRGNLKVPAGKSLTIKEGVTVIVEGDGSQGGSPEFTVYGNFYSYGTADKPVLFTVSEAKRTQANIFAGLWGGILATAESQEMVLLYTRIEYVGAPAAANSPIVTSGELKEGDPRFGLYFNNPNGKFVMMNSAIAYSKDDGMRVNQGQLLIAYNNYILTGKTGGEALNVKSGSTGDIAYNVMYSAATNAVKWSNSDDRSPQTEVNVYNNTAINSGWRQTKSGRGGSFNLEKGGRGKVFNNMIVNCRFGVRFPKSPDNPDVTNSVAGYSFYYGNNADIVAQFYPTTGTITKGLMETANDISGAVNENDPKFVNFDVTTFNMTNAANPDNAAFPATTNNFKLKSDSPALAKGKTGFSTKYTSITAGGKTYTVPAPSNFIGALGAN